MIGEVRGAMVLLPLRPDRTFSGSGRVGVWTKA